MEDAERRELLQLRELVYKIDKTRAKIAHLVGAATAAAGALEFHGLTAVASTLRDAADAVRPKVLEDPQ